MSRRTPLIDRLSSKITLDEKSGCWIWMGANNGLGYGSAPRSDGTYTSAHRVIYTLAYGPVDDGLVLDHLCRNRICVNPYHLEPVTPAENIRRWSRTITHCPRGHKYTPENTRIYRGMRSCKTCHRERMRSRRLAVMTR